MILNCREAARGFNMHADREHVISVVLNHDDWQEFVKLQPEPVDWLRDRIQEMIAAASNASSGNRSSEIHSVQGSAN
jgi:hypothetical protein